MSIFNKKEKSDAVYKLYVKISNLKESKDMQKDFSVHDLFQDAKYFCDEKTAQKEGYIPLVFATTIRSVYTNKVVTRTVKSLKDKTFVDLSTPSEPLPHNELDLVMYLSSISMFNFFEYKKGFDELMMQGSEHQLIGLYCPCVGLVDPIIYSHVYVKDDLVEDFGKYMRPEVEWSDIELFKSTYTTSSFKPFLDTLIVAKEEKNE